jgi:hypothetical protein
MIPPIRTERKARGWTVLTMARKIRDAADDPRDVTGIDSLVHNIHRWETGRFGVSERYRYLYCRVFEKSEFELFGTEPEASESRANDSGSQYVLFVLPKGSQLAVVDLTGTGAGDSLEAISQQAPRLTIVRELTAGQESVGEANAGSLSR